MHNRTEQLVESLLKAPALVELIKRDPAQLLTTIANSEPGRNAIKAGTQMIGDLLSRCVDSTSGQPKALARVPGPQLDVVTLEASQVSELSPTNGRSNAVGIVGVSSLAAIAGSLAVLGAVSIVAMNRREDWRHNEIW